MEQLHKVTAAVTPSELARAINEMLHFKAVVWGRYGLRRVYIKQYRFVWEEMATVKSVETEFTIYVEFKPGSTPVLTVKEADMATKDPQWECMQVSWSLSRAGIHVDCKPSPAIAPSHHRFSGAPPGLMNRCNCLAGGSPEE